MQRAFLVTPAFQNLCRTVQRPFNQESTDLMNNKLKPAIIGGVVLGVLSIIPIVNLVNVCCCLWAILGGLLASHLYVKSSPTPASAGDGAIVGALAGLVGGVLVIFPGILISYLASGLMAGIMVSIVESLNPAQAEAVRVQMEAQSIAGHIVNAFILAILLIVFSTLGGLIGIPIFEKRKGNATPPPPQNYGGGPGGPGGYGAGV
jgi:hypothetical protein